MGRVSLTVMRLPAAVLALALVVGCSSGGDVATPSPPPTVTPARSQSTTVPKPAVDPLQVVGAWVVSAAEPGAVFTKEESVTFVGDGTLTARSQTRTRTGQWRIRNDGLELMVAGVLYVYVTEAEPRQLRIGVDSGAGMILVRA